MKKPFITLCFLLCSFFCYCQEDLLGKTGLDIIKVLNNDYKIEYNSDKNKVITGINDLGAWMFTFHNNSNFCTQIALIPKTGTLYLSFIKFYGQTMIELSTNFWTNKFEHPYTKETRDFLVKATKLKDGTGVICYYDSKYMSSFSPKK